MKNMTTHILNRVYSCTNKMIKKGGKFASYAVLRIRDVFPGSRIPDLEFSITDPGSRGLEITGFQIPDPDLGS